MQFNTINNFNRSKPVVSVRILPNQFKRYENKLSNLQPIYKRKSLSFLPQSDLTGQRLCLAVAISIMTGRAVANPVCQKLVIKW